jgi:hypothetical protein
VLVHAGVVVNGRESSLGPAVQAPDVAHVPDSFIRLRAQVVGANPATIRVRAWADGTAEPSAWQFSATDSTSALQTAGAAGVHTYLSSDANNGPVTVSFDGLVVTGIAPATPTPAEVMVGAGDIASCAGTGDEATATLLDGIPGTVVTFGDNVYDNGTAAEFDACYAPTWGRQKYRTRPSVGNHEYGTPDAAGYFGYFGSAAGDPGKGYYAYDIGAWRVYALNSQCSFIGGCGAGSSEEQWLRSELAANPRECVAAYWHEPRFSSGSHGNAFHVDALWRALYEAGAELVLNGHDHNYERFGLQDPDAVADPTAGIREFIVGTGGIGLRSVVGPIQPNSELNNSTDHGVLRLTLIPTGYEWQFLPVAGKTFTDAGNGVCH